MLGLQIIIAVFIVIFFLKAIDDQNKSKFMHGTFGITLIILYLTITLRLR